MLSGGGLVAYGLTITFASFDWLMSLEPHWFSTIYGVLIIGGQGLSAMAFLIVVLVWLSRRPPLDRHRRAGALSRSRQPDARVRDAVGVLLVLAVPDHLVGQPARGDRLVPAPAADRLARSSALLLIVFHFVGAVRRCCCRGTVKREPQPAREGRDRRCCVARLIDLFWLIAPEFHRDGIVVSWMDIVLPLTLGAIWLGCFIWQLRGRAILPVHDPQFDEALGRIIERGAPPRTAH